MPKPQYGNEHQKQRRIAIDNLIDGTLCFRCGRPMYKRQSLDLDHVVPIARGGLNGPTRLTHSVCNRSAGGKLAGRLKRIRRRRAGNPNTYRQSPNRDSNPHRRLPKW